MLLTLLTLTASAAELDSLSLSAMSDWGNAPYNNSKSIGVAYDKVVRQAWSSHCQQTSCSGTLIGLTWWRKSPSGIPLLFLIQV